VQELELWAGVECTVNRVGARYFDQLARSGHEERAGDLERIHALGVRVLRFALLWEHHQPAGPRDAISARSDARLEHARVLGLRPIAGLLHHGSGPRWTSLLDPEFPKRFAAYAGAIAERYPWIDHYTPINEPLTTARFSALYGLWFPHARDDASFCRALVNQLAGTVLAMGAIRTINPAAKLVQTEDYGQYSGSPVLAYQIEFHNHLRWLTYDLLSGRVGGAHPLYSYLTTLGGLTDRDLAFFLENPCSPDILGMNHYVTSDRFLDIEVEKYPPRARGGNGRHRYADVETVRGHDFRGHEPMILDAWERYHLPVAITEVHLDCRREDQLRWVWEAWTAARRARARGAAVHAITLWSLFGAFDWNTLVTENRGYYESGAFDLRAPEPRPTALAAMARSLTSTGTYDHAVLRTPGWWHGSRERPRTSARPILILGASGSLGRAIGRTCAERGLEYRLLSRNEMDITSLEAIRRAIATLDPWAVVNAAGYVRVDDAEDDAVGCFAANTTGPRLLAEACDAGDLQLLTFSSDLVFDGARYAPYLESDLPAPLNVYGHSKALAEKEVVEACDRALVVRTSAFFSPWDEHNFVHRALRTLARGERFEAANDQTVSPTYVPALANVCLDLLVDGATGLWHVANRGAVTWAELAARAVHAAGLPADLIEPRSTEALKLRARRPRFSALASEHHRLMPELDASLAEYARAVGAR
jgi:dTDP-4-dehydrorhamnose reductase